MFCNKCGAQYADGASFCTTCGAQLTVARPSKPPLSSNPVINTVKKAGSSPLMLVSAIGFSLTVLIQFVMVFLFNPMFTALVREAIDEALMEYPFVASSEYYFNEILPIINTVMTTIEVVFIVLMAGGLIITGLILAGMWITYSSAANRRSDGMKTSGLTMIKCCAVFEMVIMIIFLLVILIGFMLATVSIAQTGEGSIALLVLVISLIIIVGAGVLNLVYYAKVLKTINSVKNTIKTGVPSEKVSRFVAVMCFISAAFSLLSLPFSIGQIATSICLGILIFKYRSDMQKHLDWAATPVYTENNI